LSQARQRVIKRSLSFYRLPLGVLAFLTALLVWEIVRINVPHELIERYPFSITALGVAPTTALVGVLATLLFGRAQYAFVTRPLIGAGSDGWHGSKWSKKWTVYLYNGGPGHATVIRYEYYLVLTADLRPRGPLDYLGLRSALLAAGLKDEKDFRFRWISPGAPLPPQKSAKDGLELFTLNYRTIKSISKLEVLVWVTDVVGDRHEWRRDFSEIAPSDKP
jgi:hypothetical protein